MATAHAERRYTLTMNEVEAQTLFSILANIYIDDQRERFQPQTDALIHLHEVLAKAGGLNHEIVFPLVAGD